MRTDLVVVFRVRQQYVTEMPLAEHNIIGQGTPRRIEPICRRPCSHDRQAGANETRLSGRRTDPSPGDAVGMIIEKCFPTLGRRASTPGHVLGHAGLSLISMPSLRSSPWIRGAPHNGLAMPHLLDKLGISGAQSAVRWQRSRLPAPVQSEASTMPRATVSGLTIAASQIVGTSDRPTNTTSVDDAKENFLGAPRRRTFICCRNVQISASSVARDRIRSTTIQLMNRQRSLIAQQHRPIRRHPPSGLGLRQGRRERWVDRLRYVKLQACNCRIVVLA
jgi:hypothetical protein